MKITMHISRILLGIVFLGAGMNGFFVIFGLEPFIETSPEAMALFEFEYLLIAEKSLEVICGILLFINQFVPLAVAILTPLIVNILMLHLFLDPTLLPLAIVLTVANGFMLFYYRQSFQMLFERKPL